MGGRGLDHGFDSVDMRMTDRQQIALLKRQLKSIKRKRDGLKEELGRHGAENKTLREDNERQKLLLRKYRLHG